MAEKGVGIDGPLQAYGTRGRGTLPREDLVWMLESSSQLALRRGAPFCRAGETDCRCGMLMDGVLQVYDATRRGRRVVLDLIFPGTLALPFSGSGLGPALATIEAVTDCTLRIWPALTGGVVPDEHSERQRRSLRVAEEALWSVRQRYLATRTLNARERFARMAAELPDEWRLLPQHVIASYLGITPQYLSRIKRGTGAVA